MGFSKKHTWCGILLCGLILFSGSAWSATLKITGATNIDDAKIRGVVGDKDKNYGGAATVTVTSLDFVLIRVKNLSSLLPANATISSCVCSLYCTTNTDDDTIYAYRIFKPWVEGDEDGVDDDDGDVTSNDWVSDANEWGTANCACAGDDGVDNSQDGTCDASGRDRKATQECLTWVTTVNTWYAFPVSAALAQDWYDGDAVENGILLVGGHMALGGGSNTFATTENATAENRLHWTITYKVNARKERILKITQ